jgi:hypothetical protein
MSGILRPHETACRETVFPGARRHGKNRSLGTSGASSAPMHLSSLEAVPHPEAHPPFRFLVKLGYAVKGLVYGILGVLALRVGISDGGRLAGEHEAMKEVARHSFGDAALVVVGGGLAFYALWRFIEAAFDPYRVGHSLKGAIQRTSALMSGIGNGFVALTAIQLALGERDTGKHPRVWAALAMREDWGPALLMGVGVCIAGVGVFHLYEAFTGKFCDRLDLAGSSRVWRSYVSVSGRVGFAARGVLFVIGGIACFRAGESLDPRKVRGMRESLHALIEQPFGPALLVATAIGLLAYALHLVTTAPIRKLAS